VPLLKSVPNFSKNIFRNLPEPISYFLVNFISSFQNIFYRYFCAQIFLAIFSNQKESAMKIETMKDAFIHDLSDIHNAEKQLTKALPKMAEAASGEDLSEAFKNHLKETEEQITKLERVAESCKIKIKRKKCEAMAGLIAEGSQIMKEVEAGAVCDALLIGSAQKIEHYEIASYGFLIAVAKQLDFMDAAEILQDILNEEKQTDEKLNQLALSGVNEEAAQQETTNQKNEKGNTMPNRNQYSNRDNNMPDRDEYGRFMSNEDSDYRGNGRGRQSRYEDNDNGYQSRGRSSRYEDDDRNYRNGGRSQQYSSRDDRYYDDDRRDDRGSSGQGRGWFGDPEGHAEAGRQSHGGRGRSANYSSRDDRYYDDRDDGRGRSGQGQGWFGDPEGHAEAGRQSHGGRGRSANYSSRDDDRYDDDRSYRDNGRSRGSSGQGRGWFGDPEGHAEAGRHSHDNDRGRNDGRR
jgi:ferritin-like metal-binding protein YciE